MDNICSYNLENNFKNAISVTASYMQNTEFSTELT